MIKIFQAIYSFLTHRLFIFLLIVGVMFYVLVLRLFQLQIVEGANLESEFELSVLKEITIDGKRGNIYDRNGYPLAENKIAFSVQYDDSVSVTDKNDLFYRLIQIIRRNGDELIQSFPISVDEDQNYIFTQSDTQVLRFKKVVFKKKTLTAEQIAMNAQGVITYMKNDLLSAELPQFFFKQHLIRIFFSYLLGKGKNIEKGIRLSSDRLFRFFNKKTKGLIGCNFSLYKQDLLAINGFDNQYEVAGVGEDTDIEYRLVANGVKVKNLFYRAVMLHAIHPELPRGDIAYKIFADTKKKNQIIALDGYQQAFDKE
jgi:hypothetical protein